MLQERNFPLKNSYSDFFLPTSLKLCHSPSSLTSKRDQLPHPPALLREFSGVGSSFCPFEIPCLPSVSHPWERPRLLVKAFLV